jgi:hypothetical protein
MLHFVQNLAKESIPMETTLCFSCEPNGHVGKNLLQILSFKIPLPFLQSKGSLRVCVKTNRTKQFSFTDEIRISVHHNT